ncbi:MAG TPA: zinc-binding dehydrogenase [Thermoleophilaceae bacterium]|nr:zinc-binding dehydrogenase [Thermoleophilaceae bacterium]
MRAVQVSEVGGPEVLRVCDVPEPRPGEGEVLIDVALAGVNFGDTHQREGQYIAERKLPFVLGGEVAGTVDGRRVVALLETGGYAERAVAPAAHTFEIPDGVSDHAALALLIQGLTAWHLYRTAARLGEGESVVVHSAAGGVGGLAVQLAKPMGAGRVIATAGSPERRERALELGADAVVDPDTDELTAALVEANRGEPVDVVLETAGGRVFEHSLQALAPFGRLVAYGNSTREKVRVSNAALLKTSRAVVGFWLMHLLDRPEMLAGPLADLFSRAARGELQVQLGPTYTLEEVRQAHEDLAGRRTTGKLALRLNP